MTKSGFRLAAALASSANGQATGSLHAWATLPLILQPVSPSTRILCVSATGGDRSRCVPSGSLKRTVFAFGGTTRLQTKGKLASDDARTSIAVGGAPLKLT